MPVVESPAWDNWPASAPGSEPEGNFVLMKIDPVASVAIFEDEETTRAAAALERHEWVLGLVTGLPPGLPDANGKESMSLRLELIGQGPPRDKPIASLPFAPSPQLYEDRPPIELHPRLPWPDIYLHSYYSSSVLISRIHHGSGYFQVLLTGDELAPINRRAFNDRVIWETLPPVTVEEEGNAIPKVEFAGSLARTDSLHSSESSDESSSSEESLYAQQREDMGMKLLKARIYAEISLDPATCPGPLGCPADLVGPVARIRELWASWQDRMTTEILAKRPATTAWIQSVDAARYGSEDEPSSPHDGEVPLDDTAVLPEDAVDDRFERARSTDRPPGLSTPTPAGVVLSGPDPVTTATPPGSGIPASPPPPISPGDGDADPDTSAPVPQVPGTSAQPQPTAPSQPPGTTPSPAPKPSPRETRVSIVQRVLQFCRRVKPAVVRAKAGVKRITTTGTKPRAGIQ